MRRSLCFLVVLSVICLSARITWADDFGDLRKEMQALRSEYQQRVDDLQSRFDAFSQIQQAQIEAQQERISSLENTIAEGSGERLASTLTSDQLIQIEDQQNRILSLENKIEDIDSGMWNVEYVGRYNSTFKKGGLVAESPSGLSKVTLGGYMDHEYEDFQNTNSTFDQHRYIINVGAEIGERLQFYSEIELEHGATDGNNAGDGSTKIEQAFTNYLINDWINLRAGIILAPFGRLNIYHDSDLRDLTDRPLVDKEVIPTTWSESGIGFYGNLDSLTENIYEDLAANYEIYVINGLDGVDDKGLSKGSLKADTDNSKSIVGRVAISPFLGHEIGFSGYWGAYDDAGDNIGGSAVDWLSTFGPLEFTGEYAHFDVDEPDFTPGTVTDVAQTFDGLRLETAYHFWPEFLNDTFLGRDFEDPTFTAIYRYGWVNIDDDSDAGTGDNEETRHTIGFNYRPVESWVAKFEYQWNATDNEALQKGDNNGFITSFAMGF